MKKQKTQKKYSADSLRESNPKAIEMLDLVNRFPLKNPTEIVTKNSTWKVNENHRKESSGIASFVMY